ncbi:MAG: potassium channel protein [Spirochaetales bacterium]|uniref:Potassium channel protein n=1 Tax=Candidatus Thalassospirochaeta sargassi TaxID=3119039 RepID=A0AAJ1MLK5_9SPIO|nr:potassium channel protein [Spirochaetales bacterium]
MIRIIKTVLPLLILALLLSGAVFGFSHFENLDGFEALWMTVTTVLTIGFGDLIPVTTEGRILAILLVPLCIILFTYFMGLIIGFIVEFNISPLRRSQSMERKIKRMNKHIIVCGFNPMSRTIIDRIQEEKRDFVLVDPDEAKCEPYIEKFNIVIADPCEDDVLRRAGIEKAEGLITSLSDAENILIIMSAREMAPGIRITSCAERLESESKLIRAGADKVINPERLGGTRMALSILKPAAMDYIDRVFISDQDNFKINEFLITEGSNLIGVSIRNAEIRNRYDLSVMAVKRAGQIYTSQLADFTLKTNDMLIVFGKEDNLNSFSEASHADQI